MFGGLQWDEFAMSCNPKLMFGSNVLGLIYNIKLIPFRPLSIQLTFSLFSRFTMSFSFRLRLLTLSNTCLISNNFDYTPALQSTSLESDFLWFLFMFLASNILGEEN